MSIEQYCDERKERGRRVSLISYHIKIKDYNSDSIQFNIEAVSSIRRSILSSIKLKTYDPSPRSPNSSCSATNVSTCTRPSSSTLG